jgi:hypothetical protein
VLFAEIVKLRDMHTRSLVIFEDISGSRDDVCIGAKTKKKKHLSGPNYVKTGDGFSSDCTSHLRRLRSVVPSAYQFSVFVDMVLKDELDTDKLALEFKKFIVSKSKDKRHAKVGGGGGGGLGGGTGESTKKKDVDDVRKCMQYMVSMTNPDEALRVKWATFLIKKGLFKRVMFEQKELVAMYNANEIDEDIKELLEASPNEIKPSKKDTDEPDEAMSDNGESDESDESNKMTTFDMDSDDDKKKMSPKAKSSAAKSKMESAMSCGAPKRNLDKEAANEGNAKKPRGNGSEDGEGSTGGD